MAIGAIIVFARVYKKLITSFSKKCAEAVSMDNGSVKSTKLRKVTLTHSI